METDFLEKLIYEFISKHGTITVFQAMDELDTFYSKQRVLVSLNRMMSKDLIFRERRGTSFIYQLKKTEEE